MIWKLPWALAVAVLHVAFVVSWMLLPEPRHDAIWCRPWACRFAFHDYRGTGEPWTYRCTRCGTETISCPH